MIYKATIGGLEYTATVSRHKIGVTGPWIKGQAEYTRDGRGSAEHEGHRAITYTVHNIVLRKLDEIALATREALLRDGKRVIHGPNVSMLADTYERLCDLVEGSK